MYILKCSDASYYTGITNNLERQLAEHNEGLSKFAYTFKRRPVQLICSQVFHDAMQAIALEKQIKGWSRSKKEAFINEDWEKLKLYAKNYTNEKIGSIISDSASTSS